LNHIPANIYTFNGAKGTFIVKNPELERILEVNGHNTEKTMGSNFS
jgi:hypothetical protein